MITGKITLSLEPVVECILVAKKEEFSRAALIDTGFNGFLSAPNDLLVSLGWRFLGYEKYEIATGEVVRQRIYFGFIKFMGLKQEVIAVASHAKDVLIGTRLLNADRCVLNINFPHRSIVIKEKNGTKGTRVIF
jgi:clan AA aspartic protease